MTSRPLRVGTRGSTLALAQSGQLAAAIADPIGATVELIHIRTEGDTNPGPLATIGGTGVFVTAVRTALQAGEVDLIVHSFKDLPTAAAAGLSLVAVPLRASPADALCAREGQSLAQLAPNATVGTGSPRRMAQIRSLRDDLRLIAIRGNIGTRLRRLQEDLDAVVLAAAGLWRMGLDAAITEEFDPAIFLPAPAQGALAVECRSNETHWFASGLSAVNDTATRWAAIAERGVLAGLEAGCSAPVSALGRFRTLGSNRLTLAGQVTSTDGTRVLRRELAGEVSNDGTAAAVGQRLAAELLSDGAAELVHNP